MRAIFDAVTCQQQADPSASREVCEVDRGRVRVLLERLQVLPDHLGYRLHWPKVIAADVQILVLIHLDVVDLREVQGRAAHVHAAEHLRAGAGQGHVPEVQSALLPARGHQVRSAEAEQCLAVPHHALAGEHVRLVHAVDRPVGGQFGAEDDREGQQEVRRASGPEAMCSVM